MAEDEANSRGNAAFSAGNFTEAITHFTEAIDISPNNHILYSNRSAAYASRSNFTQALTDAQKTVQLKPDWPKGYSCLGAAYFGLKNYSEAVSSYEKGLEFDPDNDALQFGLTRAKLELERTNYSPKQWELKNAFNATKPVEELFNTYEEMETCFGKVLLIVECLNLMKALRGANRLQDASLFLQKVNKLMLGNDEGISSGCSLADNSDFTSARSLNMMGSVCYDVKNYVECFKCLSLAYRILTSLDVSSCCDGNCFLRALETNQYKLHKVCLFTHKLDESVLYGKKHLEVKEKLLGEDCVELALANMDVFFAYAGGMEFREAIPFGLKALEIQMKCLGSDSLEAAKMRSNLSFMYRRLGEHDKARELEELSDNVLKTRESADDMIEAGRYEEAIAALEIKVSRADMKEDERALDLLSMAYAFYKMGNFTDAMKRLGNAEEILEKCPGLLNKSVVSVLFVEMSGLYKKMDVAEAAVSLIKRVLAICLALFWVGLVYLAAH